MNKKRERLIKRANALRNRGFSYSRIDSILQIPRGKAWILCNLERHRQNSRESNLRYAARGGPIYAMED